MNSKQDFDRGPKDHALPTDAANSRYGLSTTCRTLRTARTNQFLVHTAPRDTQAFNKDPADATNPGCLIGILKMVYYNLHITG